MSGGVFLDTVIQGRHVTVQLPAPVVPALSGLPSPSATFTGRDGELRTVLASLAPDGALRIVELCGRLTLAGFRTARRSAVLG
ncbi:hypothetical protein [Streptomyces noursei]|uniref:hypothetical protein n=1 Tax=Streptomyces noursei TaxID=1971 RepID=UPI0016754D8E|nr:hypothetical protein [Streptomyces noursei]MCZ1015482.1 hypothetical protein [Streptomyces noursei]GGX17834.1 hypothetical protein GCM10010341_44180 [Streptomyces noursei]